MRVWILPFMASAMFLCGCPKQQELQKPVQEPAPQAEAQPSVQPTPFPEQPAASQPTPPAAQPAQQMSGWRVQLFASGTRENARKVAEEARWKFPERQVFITEQGGLHKVQVGNGLSRLQADQLKQAAKDQGFTGAFAIEVIIE